MTRRFGLIASTLVTCGFALAVSLPAAGADTPPVSGDDRATAYPGNAATCEDAGLAGEILEDVQYFTNSAGTHLVIVSVPEGFEVTGTVVKGADAYNVYGPGDRIGLHAPLKNGQIPEISHWYVCGLPPGTTTTATTTTTTETTTTTTDTSTSESTTSESESTSSSPGESTTPGGGDSGGEVSDDELAETGFSSRGLLVAGGGLLLLGLALVFGVRASRRQA